MLDPQSFSEFFARSCHNSRLFQVNRHRVFIMATKLNATGAVSKIFQERFFQPLMNFVSTCSTLQEVKLLTQAQIHEEANRCHFFRNRPEISTWLAHDRTESDQDRLCMIGNMVLPKCAMLAMHVMARAHLDLDS